MKVSQSESIGLLNTSLQRLSNQSASCKLWSAVLTSLVLVMAAGRAGAEVLIWAATPILILALADAAYTTQFYKLATLAAKDDVQISELFRLQVGTTGFSSSFQMLSGLGSFSVWPFYTVLATMVIVLGLTVLPAKPSSQIPPVMNNLYQPGTSRPAYTMQQGGGVSPSGGMAYPGNPNMQPNGFTAPTASPSFQPPNQTVTRPNIPPMGISVAKPNPQGVPAKPSVVPKPPPSNNRPVPTK